ncbi:MAG TPA: hypothetical protein VFH73_16535, partial [Polyangia bacterium]|nr:hypothetical protein [Polyangia bacterium]
MLKSFGGIFSIASLLALGCGSQQGKAPPDAGTPAPTTMMSNICPALTGPGVKHAGTISANETWTAADSPHVVTSALDVVGATLTIEPCAVVRVKEGFTISFGGGNPGDPAA